MLSILLVCALALAEPIPPEAAEAVAEVSARRVGDRLILEPAPVFDRERDRHTVDPASIAALAGFLGAHPEIEHVVVVVYAGDAGVYDHELSMARRRALWEGLLRAGVQPGRISYLGERAWWGAEVWADVRRGEGEAVQISVVGGLSDLSN